MLPLCWIASISVEEAVRIVLLLPPRNKLDPRGGGGSRQRNCSSLVSNATRIYGKLYSRVDYHVGSNRWVSISPSCLMMDRFDSGNKVLQADKQISSWAQTNGMFWSTGVFREMTRSRFLARPTRCAKDENPRSLSEENSLLSYSRRVLLGGIC